MRPTNGDKEDQVYSEEEHHVCQNLSQLARDVSDNPGESSLPPPFELERRERKTAWTSRLKPTCCLEQMRLAWLFSITTTETTRFIKLKSSLKDVIIIDGDLSGGGKNDKKK